MLPLIIGMKLSLEMLGSSCIHTFSHCLFSLLFSLMGKKQGP